MPPPQTNGSRQPPEGEPDPWASATWEGARMITLLEGARMSLAQKLEWLEELGKMADSLFAERERKRGLADPGSE